MFENLKGLGSLASMMKDLPKIKEKMEQVKARLGEITVEAETGGGAVRATANAQLRLLSLNVDQALLAGLVDSSDPGDRAMAEDLIIGAVNAALEKAREAAEQEMKTAAGDAQAAAAEAKSLIKQTSDAVTRIDGHVESVARALTDDLEIASSLLTRLHSVVEKIDRGEGTMGLLLADNRLYESLLLTFRRLAETTEEFRLLIKEWQKGKVRVAF